MDSLHSHPGCFLDAAAAAAASASPFSPSSREDIPSSAASTHHSSHHDLDDFHFDFEQAFTDLDSVSFALQKSSHDDACLSTCVAGMNGFPHHQTPAAHRGASLSHGSHARQRHSVSSVPCTPYTTTGFSTDFYPPIPVQHFHQPQSYSGDLDFRLPLEFDHKGNQISFQSVNHLGHVCTPGADICQLPQCPMVDDCASVNCSMVSCSEQCCSVEVCHDESCTDGLCRDEGCDQGTPCDNVDCLDSSTMPDHFDPMWHVHPDEWSAESHLRDQSTLHGQQPCNHTNAEHDVAATLRDLKAPSTEIHPGVFQSFGCSLLDGLDHSDGAHHNFSPTRAQPDLTYASTVDSSPSESKTDSSTHTCQWVTSSAEPSAHENLCGKSFQTAEELNDHLCQDHITLMSSKTRYLCLWKGCLRREDQVFASRNKLRRHIATHTCYKPHQCLTCGERFSAKQALDQHERTHTGDKPYTCPYDGCGKSFKQKSALTMHIRTHTGEKPLKCEICGKSFCESSNLSKHRKTHNPDYKYKCDEPGCDSQFIRIDQLRRHQAKHVRQKKKSEIRSSQQQQKNAPTKADLVVPTVVSGLSGSEADWPLIEI